MKRLSPATRLSLGLTALVVGLLMLADILGFVPNAEKATLAGRARLCETLALSSSAQLMRNDIPGLRATLQGICERDHDVLSMGLREADGDLLFEYGEHSPNWTLQRSERSTESEMQVPIFQRSAEKWGSVEIRFRPLRGSGIWQYLKAPMVLLVGFVSQSCMLAFGFFLRLALRHLDPSKAVPKRVRDALDNLAEGLLILDTKDHILLANHAFGRVLGLDAERLVGRRASKLPWQRESSKAVHDFPWKQALVTQRPVSNARLCIQDSQGKVRIFSVNCSPLLGHQSRYCGVMATFDDVTVLEETNRELGIAKKVAEDAQLAAENASRAKSEFLANMSHEIRTPLNAVMGFTDVLRRGMEENPRKRLDYLNTIHASGTHLLELINDILDLSKIEAGKLELEFADCSPSLIVHDLVTVMQIRARQKDLALEFRVDGKIPEKIRADATRLRQILMNLVGNAIKFTSQGAVRIVCRIAIVESQPAIQFDVIDSGIGMTPAQLERVFNPFEQADNTVARRFGGTGLGLSISKRFANAMGGDITVRSQPGEGSTFTVTIPLGNLRGVRMLDDAHARRLVESRSQEQAAGPLARIRPSRVLLVDDGESNRELASLVLRRVGVDVTEAVDGQQAVELAGKQQFDLILMDMQMPVMDGYSATRVLRDDGLTIPIVALTANAMRGDEEKCRAAGCSHFLTKPIDINALIQLLAQLLGTENDTATPSRTGEHGHHSAAISLPATAGNRQDLETEPRERSSSPEGPLPRMSTSSFDDPELRRIADKFVDNLISRLQAMFTAFSQGDFDSLAGHAHWLKGAGGTVGFGDFTEPARRLETLARQQASHEVAPVLAELIELAKAIQANPDDARSSALAAPTATSP